MNMQIAFLVDPLHTLNIASDSSIFFMEKSQQHDYRVATFSSSQLFYENGQVKAQVDFIKIDLKKQPWFQILETKTVDLSSFNAIIIRKDPPFDQEYLYVTYLLELLEQGGTIISNSAQAIRDANEKLVTTQFSHLMPSSLVTNQIALLTSFVQKHGQAVIKPLNAMAGRDVILVNAKQPGYKALLNMASQNEQVKVMAQEFLPEISEGDKRIFLLNGKALPYALLRKPAADDFRANLAIGGSGKVVQLNQQDYRICQEIAPVLKARGLDFAGIDVIGPYLIEINVTSPTGIVAVFNQTHFNIADEWIKMIDERVKNR